MKRKLNFCCHFEKCFLLNSLENRKILFPLYVELICNSFNRYCFGSPAGFVFGKKYTKLICFSTQSYEGDIYFRWYRTQSVHFLLRWKNLQKESFFLIRDVLIEWFKLNFNQFEWNFLFYLCLGASIFKFLVCLI